MKESKEALLRESRLCMEVQCSGLLGAVRNHWDLLIKGHLPRGISLRKVKAVELDKNRYSAPFGLLIAEVSRGSVTHHMGNIGYFIKSIFWEKANQSNNSAIRGNLKELFPNPNGIMKDLFDLFPQSFFIVGKNGRLNLNQVESNKILLSRFENLIGWIDLLNGCMLNRLDRKGHGDWASFKRLKKSSNVLGRHSPPEKNYSTRQEFYKK